MAEHNFGTLCSLLIIFSFTKFVSQNSLKMKAKFLVGKSQYQWFFPLSRKKDPTDSCQTGFNWNICGSQMAYPQPQQKRILEAVPQPSVPTLRLSHAAWGRGNDGIPWLSSPGVRPRWATQDSLSAQCNASYQWHWHCLFLHPSHFPAACQTLPD